METLTTVDAVALGLLAAAALRGLWIGAIREAFSLAALASAFLAVRLGTVPLAERISDWLPVGLSAFWLRLACGAALASFAVLAVGLLGRILRRGARAAGLGLVDRLLGAALGAAEGALVVGLLLALAVSLLGPDHASLRKTRALAALEAAERVARPDLPDVAAPPPRHGRRSGS